MQTQVIIVIISKIIRAGGNVTKNIGGSRCNMWLNRGMFYVVMVGCIVDLN